MKSIICLDFDDCIYPVVENNINCNRNIALMTLELNLLKILELIKDKDVEIHITSSWGQYLYKKDDRLYLECETSKLGYMDTGFDLIKKYLDDYLMGFDPNNDRIKYILNLQTNEKASTYKICIIDDINLKDLEKENCKYFKLNNNLDNFLYIQLSNYLKK